MAVRRTVSGRRIALHAAFGLGAFASACLLTTALISALVMPSAMSKAVAEFPVRTLGIATTTPVLRKTSRLPSPSPADHLASEGNEAGRNPDLRAAIAAASGELRTALLERAQLRGVEESHEPSGTSDALEQPTVRPTEHNGDEPVSGSNGVLDISRLPVPVPRPEHLPPIKTALPIPRPRAAPATKAVALHIRQQPSTDLLGYAKAHDESQTTSPALAAVNRVAETAVYDIEAGAVYLPNGETLEAHSGMGVMRDNPAFVNRRNNGPTPPHVYDLTLREAPFHGVEAIRLTPVAGENATFGRDGLLAHSYLHGKRGDTNGCVAFKDYQRFLTAYKSGQIKRMVVVPRLENDPPSSSSKASIFVKNS